MPRFAKRLVDSAIPEKRRQMGELERLYGWPFEAFKGAAGLTAAVGRRKRPPRRGLEYL
jgi:hypothetical protein